MTDVTMAAFCAADPAGGDPFVNVVAGALGVPLRQLYALLWRAGLIEIVE
jgi:hypothetical protein